MGAKDYWLVLGIFSMRPGGIDTPFDPGSVEAEVKRMGEELKRQERQPPTVDELEDVTIDAFVDAGSELALWTKDQTEVSTLAFEEWNEVTTALETIFFETTDAALAQHLVVLLAKTEDELAREPLRSEAIDLIRQTAPLAHRLRPLLHRLVVLRRGSSRAEILDDLSYGKTGKNIKLGTVEVPERRLTLVGSLRELGNRLGTSESRVWNLEQEVLLPATIKVRNPLPKDGDPDSDDIQAYWRVARKAYKELHPDEPKPETLTVSGSKTEALIAELELWREKLEGRADKQDVVNALQVIEEWLEQKMVFYRGGSEEDFRLYHLGMDPEVAYFLGVIKEEDPEHFLELCGTTVEGKKSSAFGTFLHIAVANTQESGDLTTKEMMRQLLTTKGHMTIFDGAGSFTTEHYRAYAEQVSKALMPDPSKVTAVEATAIVARLVPAALAAEMTRRFEASREMNLGEYRARLRARIDDLEHPMLLLEYLANAPLIMFADPEIRIALGPIFGNLDKQVAGGEAAYGLHDPKEFQRACREERAGVVRAVMNRLPVFDFENGRVGNYLPVLLQEVEVRRRWYKGGGDAEKFVSQAGPYRRGVSYRLLADLGRRDLLSSVFPDMKKMDEEQALKWLLKRYPPGKGRDQFNTFHYSKNWEDSPHNTAVAEDKDLYYAQLFAYQDTFTPSAIVEDLSPMHSTDLQGAKAAGCDVSRVVQALTVLNRPNSIKYAFVQLKSVKDDVSPEAREAVVRGAFLPDVKWATPVSNPIEPKRPDQVQRDEERARVNTFHTAVYTPGLLPEERVYSFMRELEWAQHLPLAEEYIEHPELALKLLREARARNKETQGIADFLRDVATRSSFKFKTQLFTVSADAPSVPMTELTHVAYFEACARLPGFADKMFQTEGDWILTGLELNKRLVEGAADGVDIRLALKAARAMRGFISLAEVGPSFIEGAKQISRRKGEFFNGACSKDQAGLLTILSEHQEARPSLAEVAGYFAGVLQEECEALAIADHGEATWLDKVHMRGSVLEATMWRLLWISWNTRSSREIAHEILHSPLSFKPSTHAVVLEGLGDAVRLNPSLESPIREFVNDDLYRRWLDKEKLRTLGLLKYYPDSEIDLSGGPFDDEEEI